MRTLDEVAAAIHLAGGRASRPLVSGFGLSEQFDHPIEPKQWVTIQRYLACPLPLLERVSGVGFLPVGIDTIWELVDHAVRFHPDWEPPAERTVAAWRNAQIFAAVRVCLADAGALDEEQIQRKSRLKRDPGLDC